MLDTLDLTANLEEQVKRNVQNSRILWIGIFSTVAILLVAYHYISQVNSTLISSLNNHISTIFISGMLWFHLYLHQITSYIRCRKKTVFKTYFPEIPAVQSIAPTIMTIIATYSAYFIISLLISESHSGMTTIILWLVLCFIVTAYSLNFWRQWLKLDEINKELTWYEYRYEIVRYVLIGLLYWLFRSYEPTTLLLILTISLVLTSRLFTILITTILSDLYVSVLSQSQDVHQKIQKVERIKPWLRGISNISDIHACLLYMTNQHDDSDKVYLEAAMDSQNNSHTIIILLYKSYKHSLQDEVADAIRICESLILMTPNDPLAIMSLAEVYLFHQIASERALELTDFIMDNKLLHYQSTLRKLEASALHAWALAANGHSDEARNSMKNIKEQLDGIAQPDHIRYCAAWVAYHLGQKERALRAFEYVRDTYADTPNANNAIKVIEMLGLYDQCENNASMSL